MYNHNSTFYTSDYHINDDTVPISLEELNKWYQADKDARITAWYQSNHAKKYELYLQYLADNRDLTDEEMLAELD